MVRAHAEERRFGLSVGIVLCLLAVWLAWRGRPSGALILAATGATLIALGFVRPTVISRPAVLWRRVGAAVGHVNTVVLLTAMFYLVLVPLSIVWRVVGRDPLARNRARAAGWSPYPARYRRTDHYTRMY